MVKLHAPTQLENGEAFAIGFTADERVAGRLRLTRGTEALEFTLKQEGKEDRVGSSHRVRGREGTFSIADWGDHASGTELVLRFEGAKLWMTVV